MFKLVFSKMYDNNIFTKYGLVPVVEDYFRVKENGFCIADGVTRDDINGNAVKYPENEIEAKEWVKNYPNPSGAYEAAKIICESFIEEISLYENSKISEIVIENSIKKSNDLLKKINENRKIDYLKDDFYCCEAVGGIIVDDFLYCFSLGDCHICVLNKDFEIIFETINNHKQFEDYLNEIYVKQHDFDWEQAKYRVMVRKEYRNNPSKKYNGKEVSYGAFSGEKAAEHYIDTYNVNLENAKYVCAYSDGCEPFFENKEKRKELLNNFETLKKYGKERTLVVYERVN